MRTFRSHLIHRCFTRPRTLPQSKPVNSSAAVSSRVVAYADETKYVGDLETNNAAEYHGLMLALQLAQQHQATHVHVHMDSQLIVRQMMGQYRVKAANLRKLHQQCKELSAALPYVTFSHVAREENTEADRLANEAIDTVGARVQLDK
ncbi:Reverse transcriptase-like [Phytophthora infestans]|uniref:Reverse transcriptase-like n=1 Tax=Phytophthora infestans TaxID=4787 RepID=A0A833T013_PHYIN|nr:Reverse transcriptase-like [Phytophthora infestans]